MDREAWNDHLRRTLADRRLSRGEQRALASLIEDQALPPADLAHLRAQAFELAAGEMGSADTRAVLEWLREVTALFDRARLAPADAAPAGRRARTGAWFTPRDDAVRRITALLRGARRSVDLCVFTITDDRLSGPIEETHRRGVRVRIITDDEKRADEGSDIPRLARAGIPVVTDRDEHHMHHKFALFDRALVLTGSYNWTRSAARNNRENLCLVDDARIVRAYTLEFGRLWRAYRGNRTRG